MAVRNLLGSDYLRKRVKQRTTGAKKHDFGIHQKLPSEESKSHEIAPRLSLPNFGIVPQTPIYTAYELAKIGKENIWFNYASAKEMMILYEKAMLKSKKCLSSFSQDSLIRFIETNLIEYQEHLEGFPDMFEFVESNAFLCFDSQKNKVDYKQTLNLHLKYHEDITSPWYQIETNSKNQMEFRYEYQVLMSLITPIDHVFLLDFNTYLNNLSLGEIAEYIKEIYQEDHDYYRNELRWIKSAMKYSQSEQFKKKQEYFLSLYNQGEKNLYDKVIDKIKSKKYRIRVDPDELCESLSCVIDQHKEFKEIIERNHYHGELYPFSNCIITDGSSKGKDLCTWYLTLVKIDMENIAMRDITHEFSLLDNSQERFTNFIKHLEKIL